MGKRQNLRTVEHPVTKNSVDGHLRPGKNTESGTGCNYTEGEPKGDHEVWVDVRKTLRTNKDRVH